MTRFNIDSLVEEVLSGLSGYSLDQPKLTWLTTPIDAAATAIPVDSIDSASAGLAEIGEELVYVADVNSESGDLILAPFGRGYQATTAAAWDINTRVTLAPRFPRHWVRQAINDTIVGTYDQLFGVASTTITVNGSQNTYVLPTEAEGVFSVKQQLIGPSQFKYLVDGWGWNPKDNTLDLTGCIQNLTHPVEVVYKKNLVRLTAGQEFTLSGLAESAWPCIKNGVLFHLLAPQEAGRAGVHAVQAAEAQSRRAISSTELSRQYYAAYQQLLVEERKRLLDTIEITNRVEYM